ncbi:MAG TPA: hypothetical protein ENI27_02480 [bacterium]|nr:hypothetical protein [bacterium]
MFKYLVGVDHGQAQDYTAIVVLERREITEPPGADVENWHPALHGNIKIVNLYEVRHIERPPLGTSYPDIVDRLKTILAAPELQVEVAIIVDQTGAGRPVLDMMQRSRIFPIGITITGGSTATRSDGGFHVPKKELVAALQLYLQSGRLKIASSLPEASVLKNEILNFKVKVNLKTGGESFESWRENEHDDLVLATALPIWYAQRFDVERTLADEHAASQQQDDWDPLRWGLE